MPDRPAEVRAAGGVLWRYADGTVQVALVHRPKYDDWSLPKGKLDPGEPAVVAGLREVCEETGFAAVAGRALGESRYRVLDRGRDVEKTVQWWAMRATGGEFVANGEVDRLRWLPVPSALARVSAGYDCAPLRAFAQEEPDTTTLLLVRHASAGQRGSWPGDDADRPLDEAGLGQAQALADVLPAYGPERVLAAPLARCMQTVQPIADRLGVGVEPAPAALDDQNHSSASAFVSLLCDLAAKEVPAVVCSQGEAIPAAVAALGGSLALGEVKARKGSLWALSLSAGRVVGADYVARLRD